MKRGLKSIEDAREVRKGSRYGRLSPTFILALAGSAIAAVILYVVRSESQLAEGKSKLLAERNAAMVTVGAEWQKLRTDLERTVLDSAKDYDGDFVAPEVVGKSLAEKPAVYVRLRIEEAASSFSFRAAMEESVRDGFTSCFFQQRTGGAPANSALANMPDASYLLEQPWNLRQGFQATRVLEENWATEVRNAGDDLRLRAFVRDYEHAKKVDIPLAIDITKRSEYFVFLLDEDPPGERIRNADGGAPTLDDIQRVAHPVRVYIVDLAKKKIVLRTRRTAEGAFRLVGDSQLAPDTESAMRRQVNNCALAGAVKTVLAEHKDGG